jgi:hypothetical protein
MGRRCHCFGNAHEKARPWFASVFQFDSFGPILVHGFLCLCPVAIPDAALAQFFRAGANFI